jgi:hypothetical protein
LEEACDILYRYGTLYIPFYEEFILIYQDVDGWIILRWSSERWDGVMWTRLVWLRIGTGGRLLRIWY